MKFGETIKLFRIANNCTTKELAERAGVTSSYVSQIEKLKRDVTCEKLKKIAGVFGVSISTLARISETSERENWSYKKTLLEILKLYVKE